MTTSHDRFGMLHGKDVYDRDGDRIGAVGHLWSAGAAGEPDWASVRTGFFGLNETLIPLAGARPHGEGVQVPYTKDEIKDAPHIDADAGEPLHSDGLAELYAHYGLSAGHVYRGSHHADNAMTRSEERLRVGTETDRVGTARLRKHIVTENVQTTVPVQREEVRLEREPITDANRDAAYAGRDLTESEHEVTLHAERPVVDTETVPVERVRLGKERVTEKRTVGGDVRKERIEADLPDEPGRRVL